MARGYYLLDHPPARSQYRSSRRATPTGCVVLHTAEWILDDAGPDTSAEECAAFIRRRTDKAGSYHSLGDRDSIVHMVPFDYEAFQDATGSNRWAIGLSLAMQAHTWPTLDAEHRDQLLDTLVLMAIEAWAWLRDTHGVKLPARRITKAQSDAGQPGFIPHADRDPARRSDPGRQFPWNEFLTLFARATGQAPVLTPGGGPVAKTYTVPIPAVEEIQQHIISAGVPIGDYGPLGDGVDGDPGPATVAGVGDLSAEVLTLRARDQQQREELARLRASSQDDEGRIHDLERRLTEATNLAGERGGHIEELEETLAAAKARIAELEARPAQVDLGALHIDLTGLLVGLLVAHDPDLEQHQLINRVGFIEKTTAIIHGREGGGE